jgi:hypothetical protein
MCDHASRAKYILAIECRRYLVGRDVKSYGNENSYRR